MYYFYVLKERERLTCVRVDWVYSCDVSSREKEEKKDDEGKIRVRNPKIVLVEKTREKKSFTPHSCLMI